MNPKYREVLLKRRGITARYLQQGAGPSVVYLHGAIASKGWNGFLDALSKDFTVYAPLQPGFEGVAGLENLDSIHDLVIYYLDFLDELRLERVNVVGHFLGGMLALELAAVCPHYFEKLVLLAPAGLWRDDNQIPDIFIMNDREVRSQMFHDAKSKAADDLFPSCETDEQREIRRLQRQLDLSAAGKFLWPIPDRGLNRRIHRISNPVMLLWGEDDRIVSPEYSEDFTSVLSDCRTVILPNCGHLPMLEQPEAALKAVGRFFDSGS
ncbi:alpha/beta hydrolase [SAR202 cluster bacterium AD-804-J14_MRT_500m]|nr:alpha/beta hydrolase [SAR202 cluster bacterium AD-804-J14_MRT_500m]